MIAAQVGEPFSDGDDDEGSEDDDDYGWGPTRPGKNYYEPVTERQEAGVSLTRSGEFGRVSCHQHLLELLSGSND